MIISEEEISIACWLTLEYSDIENQTFVQPIILCPDPWLKKLQQFKIYVK